MAYGFNKEKGGKAYGISDVLDYFYFTIADQCYFGISVLQKSKYLDDL